MEIEESIKCTRCGGLFPRSGFFVCSRMKNGLSSACKSCMNNSYKSSRSKKKQHYDDVATNRRKRTIEKMRAWKERVGCTFCEERFGPCLDLHHLDPSEKEQVPSATPNCSWKRFLDEAAKCIVVCGNCHRKIHHGKIVVGPHIKSAVTEEDYLI